MDGFRPIIQPPYATLFLPNQLNNFPDGYLKHLLRFNGETGLSAEDHMATFLDFTNNINIEHEYAYMRLFVHFIEDNVRIWFRQLRANSIPSWNELITIFKNQWGVKKDAITI